MRMGMAVMVRDGIYLPFGLKSRRGVIAELLPGGKGGVRMAGLRFPGHPNVTDYLPRELSKALS